jgi:hypothetical protein
LERLTQIAQYALKAAVGKLKIIIILIITSQTTNPIMQHHIPEGCSLKINVQYESSASEDACLLRCYTVVTGKQLPML